MSRVPLGTDALADEDDDELLDEDDDELLDEDDDELEEDELELELELDDEDDELDDDELELDDGAVSGTSSSAVPPPLAGAR
jgi:hypothetical protein